MKNYLNCIKENWQNIDVQVNIKDVNNDDNNDIVERKGCNTKFDIENENR